MPANRFYLMLILMAVGSSNPIAIKFALNAGWTPLYMGVVRMGIIGAFFLLVLGSRQINLLGPNRRAQRLSLLSALCKALGVLTLFQALAMSDASRVVMISTLSPIINLILVHYIMEHERVRPNHLVGVSISLLGIVGLIFYRSQPAEDELIFNPADLIILLSLLFNNGMSIFEKKALQAGCGPSQLIISNNILSVIIFALFIPFSTETLRAIPLNSTTLAAMLYLTTVVGVFLFYYRRWLVARLELSYIASFSHPGKALSILYAILILNEDVNLWHLLFFLVIIGGTWIAIRSNKNNNHPLALKTQSYFRSSRR